jgi:hypothetical protein
MGVAALSFYTTDLGAIEEVEREIQFGPFKRLIHTGNRVIF